MNVSKNKSMNRNKSLARINDEIFRKFVVAYTEKPNAIGVITINGR